MRLKIFIEESTPLPRLLSFLIPLRKVCVLRFSPTGLVVISSTLNEPQVWAKLSSAVFQMYEVQSAKNNIVSFEANIEPLYQVLRNFQKCTPTSSLSLKLSKAGCSPTDKAAATLEAFYTAAAALGSPVNYSFNIPVRLLRAETDLRIVEPPIGDMALAVKIPHEAWPLLRRVERYKTSEWLTLVGNKAGQLRFAIDEGERKVEIRWKQPLETSDTSSQTQDSDEELLKPVSVRVKLRWWNLGSKLLEISNAMSLIFHDTGCILHCYTDPEENCDVTYYIAGYEQE